MAGRTHCGAATQWKDGDYRDSKGCLSPSSTGESQVLRQVQDVDAMLGALRSHLHGGLERHTCPAQRTAAGMAERGGGCPHGSWGLWSVHPDCGAGYEKPHVQWGEAHCIAHPKRWILLCANLKTNLCLAHKRGRNTAYSWLDFKPLPGKYGDQYRCPPGGGAPSRVGCTLLLGCLVGCEIGHSQ